MKIAALVLALAAPACRSAPVRKDAAPNAHVRLAPVAAVGSTATFAADGAPRRDAAATLTPVAPFGTIPSKR